MTPITLVPGVPYAALHCDHVLNVLPQLPAESVDCIFADPPFNAGKVYASGQHDDKMSTSDYLLWLYDWMDKLPRLLKPGGVIWLMNDTRWIGNCQVMLYELGFTFLNMVVWPYSNPTPARHRFPKTWRPILLFCKGEQPAYFDGSAYPLAQETLYFNPRRATTRFCHDVWADVPKLVGGFLAPKELLINPETNGFAHLAQMPEALARRAILTSTRPGDTVLDPFCGSGTVLTVCRQEGRRCIGIEIEPSFVELSRRRIEAATQQGTLGLQDGPDAPTK